MSRAGGPVVGHNVLVIRRDGIPPCFVKALKRDGRPVMTWDEVDARRLGDAVALRYAVRLGETYGVRVEVERAA